MNEVTRIINIRYLNSIPYRAFSLNPTIDYQEGLPAECAAALLHQEVDIALLPTASVFKHGFYQMLPFGIIAQEESESVFLFSSCPLAELKQVLLDSSSETSVLLLKTLLAEFFPDLYQRLHFRVEQPERIVTGIEGNTGGLLIGDIALAHSGHFQEVLDLSGEWRRQTDYPFVFATWAYRPASLTDAQLTTFCETIHSGLEQREHFARDWAESIGIDRDGASRYVTESISYELTPSIQDGARFFCELAAKHNLLPDAVGLNGFSYFGEGVYRASIDLIIDQALELKRLSIESALRVVEEIPLTDLFLLSSRLNELRQKNSGEVYRIQITKKKDTGVSLISQAELEQLVAHLGSDDFVVLEADDGCNELTLEGIRLLLGGLKKASANLAIFNPFQLEQIALLERLSVAELIDQLLGLGVSGVDLRIPCLLSNYSFRDLLAQLELHRKIAHFGMDLVTRQPVNGETSLENLAIHLFHIRQLQDQTERVRLHLIESTDQSAQPSIEHFFRSIVLSQLVLDNVDNIAVSPFVFGAPTVEVLLELGAPQIIHEL